MDDKNVATKVSEGLQRTQKKAGVEEAKILQLIVFTLGGEEFGADINQVREIIMVGPITPIPDSPDFIKGVTNVRGEIAVVIDLKARFFLPVGKELEEKNIVITEQEKNLFGLMVDEVTEVLRIPQTEIKPTPEFVTRIDRIYISGVITIENRLIIMLDLTKVLSEEELAKLSEIRTRHEAAIEEAREKAGEEVKEEQIPQKETAETKTAKTGGRRKREEKKKKSS